MERTSKARGDPIGHRARSVGNGNARGRSQGKRHTCFIGGFRTGRLKHIRVERHAFRKYAEGVDHEAVVERYDSPHEAELAAAYLRSCGIEARIDNDVLPGMNPLWTSALGAIRVHVAAERLDEATQLLTELRGPTVSPSTTLEPADEADRVARRALASAVLGVCVCPGAGQLYSLWLLSRIRSSDLRDRGRRHRTFALVINLGFIGLVALIMLSGSDG